MVYRTWSKKKGLDPLVDEIEGGAKLVWLGSRRYERVLLWLHGRESRDRVSVIVVRSLISFSSLARRRICYARKPWTTSRLPTRNRARAWTLCGRRGRCAFRILQVASILNANVSLLTLYPALAPQSLFPAQLRELTATVQHLVSHGTSPSDIILGGDSAGGAVVLQFLSHILRPFPGIPQLSLSGPFAGVILVSPWVSFADSDDHPLVQDGRDIADAVFDNYLARVVRPTLTPENRPYYDPSTAPESWWAGLDGVVGEMLVIAGEVERRKDGIVELGNKLSKNHSHVVQRVDLNGVHIDLLVDFAAGEGGRTETWRMVLTWMTESLTAGK